MRVLVTGGAGFIGSHIVDALLQGGHSVAVIDDLSSGEQANVPAQAKFFQVDVRDQAGVAAAVQSFKPEAVCHQAAQMSVSRSVREPHFDADVNILGLINVVSAAAEAGAKRVVFASSGGVLYGEATKPAPEETPANPISPYGISKWAGEQYLKFFNREHGLNCIALRYSNVYGERQNPHGEAGVVAIFCTRMFKGEVSRVNGDGKYVRDYVHVSDVVRANVAAIQSDVPGFEPINVGTGIGTDVNELAGELLTLCRAELKRRGINRAIPELEHGPARAGDLRSNLVANEKAQRLLKWSPRVPFTEGLEKTVGWFADRLLS
ncbi:NAD-dependent epimerase/dehydratase family protein [Planctomicrobium piriforme]|uniref:UDP-glucose 4-epimerase n=1 Tax=Planctomicrobium piriforme TaxID=1576369 RepID=A0A1I3FEA3_9PLAN|nr:NAD-dependent epimerase/dehydratase family protein [Planctomicrobium piriforme]SFI09563.1 UDP-glucose 4-epimerase [Planctomicrobium piriforme]